VIVNVIIDILLCKSVDMLVHANYTDSQLVTPPKTERSTCHTTVKTKWLTHHRKIVVTSWLC